MGSGSRKEWAGWGGGGERNHHHYEDAMSYYEGPREKAKKEWDTTINSFLREKS